MNLQFDALPPFNRIGAAIIAIASLAERLAIKEMRSQADQRTFADWRAILGYIRRDTANDKFKSDGRERWLSDFLDPDGGRRIGLTQRNMQTSRQRLQKAVASAIAPYLAHSAPLQRFVAQPGIDASAVAPFLRGVAARLAHLADDNKAFEDLLEAVDPATNSGSLVSATVNALFPGLAQPRHPYFAGLDLFDETIVKSEFLGTIDTLAGMDAFSVLARGSFHLFALLREARGWAAENRSEVNMIVRDLLWIRGGANDPDYSAKDYRDDKPFLGLLVSAVDRTSFYIEKLDIHGADVIITGREIGEDPQAQRVTLIYSSSPYVHPLQLRYGILSGSTGTGRDSAAWRCAMIKPDWDFTDQLTTIAAQMTPSRVANFYAICSGVGAAGILFSEAMRQQKKEAIHDRREVFRRTLVHATDLTPEAQYRFGTSIINKLKEGIEEQIANATGMASPQLAAALTRYLDRFVQENWHRIEPAQIVNFKHRRPSRRQEEVPPELLAMLRQLLDLNDIWAEPGTVQPEKRPGHVGGEAPAPGGPHSGDVPRRNDMRFLRGLFG